jgi:intracellular septation protein
VFWRSLLTLTTELGPIFLFFIVGQVADFFTAAATLVAAALLACLVTWARERRLPGIALSYALFITVGGLTAIILQNEQALILADTLYYLLLATLLGGSLWRNQLLLKTLFGHIFAITDDGWLRLTRRWAFFLLSAALANELVRNLATPEFWIDYRFYSLFVILLFATYQFRLSRHYRLPEEATAWGLRRTELQAN